MLMTFAVTMLTTPHNLALGVLAGVALAGILFSRKVAKVIQVENIEISDQERRYRVEGRVFVSKVYFLQDLIFTVIPSASRLICLKPIFGTGAASCARSGHSQIPQRWFGRELASTKKAGCLNGSAVRNQRMLNPGC